MSRKFRIHIAALVFSACALMAPGAASAATQTITFDDLSADTQVDTEYRSSHGVFFNGQSDTGFYPVVRAGNGQASSGANVADIYTCLGSVDTCGETGHYARMRARLDSSASAVSVKVGMQDINDPGQPARTAEVRLRAYGIGGNQIGSTQTVTVTEAAALKELKLDASLPAIDYVDVDTASPDQGEVVVIDDLSLTRPDAQLPPNFGLTPGAGIVEVLQGNTVDDPIAISRTNGSNGDIALSVKDLPPGMSATFVPNPIKGTDTAGVLRLTAADTAAQSPYTEITITAKALDDNAGPTEERTTKKLVRIKENCDSSVRFDYVDARANCFKRVNQTYTAINKEVRLNGFVLKPLDGQRVLTIDAENKTIKSTGSTWAVAIDSDPDIPFYSGPISWDFKPAPTPPGVPPSSAPRKIVGFDISGVQMLKGIPMTGVKAELTKAGKANFIPTLKATFWPFSYVGGLTANTTLTLSNDAAPDFTGMEFKVPTIPALGITLKDVSFEYKQGNTWSGQATAVLNFAKKLEITGGYGVKDGQFDFLKASVGNINQPIGSGVYLQKLGFEVTKSPFSLTGLVGVSAGPSVAGKTAVSVDGGFKAVLADPWVIEVNGNVKIGGKFSVGEAFVRYSSTGLFQLGGKAKLDFGLIYLNGQIDGWVDGTDAFSIEGSIKGCVDVWGPDPCATARAILSSIGGAACLEVWGYGVGAGFTWGGDFDAFTGCDLGPWRPVGGASAAAASTGPTGDNTTVRRFEVPAGLPAIAWALQGKTDSPYVVLEGPNGERVEATDSRPFVQNPRFFVGRGQDDRTTYATVRNPAAGVWKVTTSGSKLGTVRQAIGLPKPSVKAAVSGKGRYRTLSWNTKGIPGQKVRFAEIGKGVRNHITTTDRISGSTRFRTMNGPAGARRIVAYVEQNSQPRAQLDVATFKALGLPKPLKAKQVKATRKGTRLTVSFTPGAKGFRHFVAAKLSDGRRLLVLVDARKRTATFKNVPQGVGAAVTVQGLSAGNAKGKAAKLTVKPVAKKKVVVKKTTRKK